ncbi:hypothetical protein [Secundilactobacillus collinoides]
MESNPKLTTTPSGIEMIKVHKKIRMVIHAPLNSDGKISAK